MIISRQSGFFVKHRYNLIEVAMDGIQNWSPMVSFYNLYNVGAEMRHYPLRDEFQLNHPRFDASAQHKALAQFTR